MFGRCKLNRVRLRQLARIGRPRLPQPAQKSFGRHRYATADKKTLARVRAVSEGPASNAIRGSLDPTLRVAAKIEMLTPSASFVSEVLRMWPPHPLVILDIAMNTRSWPPQECLKRWVEARSLTKTKQNV